MKNTPSATDLKDIVQNVIGQLASPPGGNPENVEELWPFVVGARAAAHTRVTGLNKNTLIVHVDSPAWLYQMNLKKNKTLQQIQEKVSQVQKIYFKIGKTHE